MQIRCRSFIDHLKLNRWLEKCDGLYEGIDVQIREDTSLLVLFKTRNLKKIEEIEAKRLR